MVPSYGPSPSEEGSDVWAIEFYRVYEGYIRGHDLKAIFRDHVQ